MGRTAVALGQFSPDVRYGPSGLLIADVVGAYLAALRLADHIVPKRPTTTTI